MSLQIHRMKNKSTQSKKSLNHICQLVSVSNERKKKINKKIKGNAFRIFDKFAY